MSYDCPLNATTQRGEILALLIKAHGDWVPSPEVMACAAQYNARVFELRRLGFAIENRTEALNGERHSWFRLLPSTKPEPEPVSDFMRRRREEDAQQSPLFAEGVA
jgi:hypothetical protein